jgi:hypothetical protein
MHTQTTLFIPALVIAASVFAGSDTPWAKGFAPVAHGLPQAQQPAVAWKVEVAGVTFLYDAPIATGLAMQQLIGRCAQGLTLTRRPDQETFIKRFGEERKQHPELADLDVKCREFSLTSTDSGRPKPAAASEPACWASLAADPGLPIENPTGTPLDLEVSKIRAAPDFDQNREAYVARMLSQESAPALAVALALNFNTTAECVAEVAALVASGGAVGSALQGPAIPGAPESGNTRRSNTNSRPLLAFTDLTVKGGKLLAQAVVMVGTDIVAASRSGSDKVRVVRMRPVSDSRGTAALRTAGYPDAVLKLYEFVPDQDDGLGFERMFASQRLFLTHGPAWAELPKNERRRDVDEGPVDYGTPVGWVEGPKGMLAIVANIPNGGRLVADRYGYVTAAFGVGFSPAEQHRLRGYRDSAGRRFTIPLTAYTYQGSDSKRYAAAFSDTGLFVMSGVWAEGAVLDPAGFSDPEKFTVLKSR